MTVPPARPATTNDPGIPFTIGLASIMILGPFAIDMYLPSLPAITRDLHTTEVSVQFTMTAYLLMLGLGQLIVGPISDAIGRRTPIIVGLILFALGAIFAAIAPSIGLLVVARAIQGAGGAACTVAVYSSVQDRARGQAATRIYAALMSISAAGPVLAPVVGGFIGTHWEWRAVFLALALLGTASLIISLFTLPESLPRNARAPLALRTTVNSYIRTLQHRAFLLPLGSLVAAFAFLFIYLGGASYIYQGSYGLSESQFSLIFGATGLCVIIGSISAAALAKRIASLSIAIGGLVLLLAGVAAAIVLVLSGAAIGSVAISMGVCLLGLGAAEPSLMGIAMGEIDSGLGAASAVIGSCQFLLGALVTAGVGVVATRGATAWVITMAVPVLIALAFIIIAQFHHRRSAGEH